MNTTPTNRDAAHSDATDPLANFRSRFVISDDLIYLDGNSLGRLPTATVNATRKLVEEEWAGELVLGWEHWIDQGVEVGDRLAPLIGASPGEVVLCDQTSVNLYKAAFAGLRASERCNVVTDRGNFPSDRYILKTVANAHGGRLIFLPEDPSADQIEEALADNVGVLSLSHVAYRSGAMLDGAVVTSIAHAHDVFMVWDLAHSAGSVPVALNDWNADLAVGCTYKHLNGGPGAPGYIYVRSDLQSVLEQPIAGWYGHTDPFAMAQGFDPSPTIRRFVVGTPPMISLVAAGVGIDLTVEAGIDLIRAKSIALTEMFLDGIRSSDDSGFTVVTPLDPRMRGSHITLRHDHAYQISQALRSRRVIPDFRPPDLIRFGFTPLYTSFTEVEQALDTIADVMDTADYLSFPEARQRVT